MNGIAGRHVGLCTKVVQLMSLFLNSKHLFIWHFVSWLTGQHGTAEHLWNNLG